MGKRKTMDEFVEEHQIRMESEWVERNPFWDVQCYDHYQCTFTLGERKLVIFFSLGWGHMKALPRKEVILNCMAGDVHLYLDKTYVEWCEHLGFDWELEQSRDKRNEVGRICTILEEGLGEAALDELLYHLAPLMDHVPGGPRG